MVWASIILPAQVPQSKGEETGIPPKIHLVAAKPGGRAIPSLGSLKEHPGLTRILHNHKHRLVVRSTAWVEDRVQKIDLGASRILESMDLEPATRQTLGLYLNKFVSQLWISMHALGMTLLE